MYSKQIIKLLHLDKTKINFISNRDIVAIQVLHNYIYIIVQLFCV